MKRIKTLRKGAGLSQRELAEMLGVHQTAVSQWEHGRTMPDIGLLPALAELFNVSVDYLLGRTDDPVDYEDGDLIASLRTEVLNLFDGDVKKAVAFQRSAEESERENAAYMRTYSWRIRELREQRAMADTDLATKAALDSNRLEGIENGAIKLSLDELERICTALGVTLAEFFSEDDSELSTRAAHLADRADELPPEAKKELEQLMEYLRHKYRKQ